MKLLTFLCTIFLVTPQDLPFQKIIVGKISYGGRGGAIDYAQFEKNRLIPVAPLFSRSVGAVAM